MRLCFAVLFAAASAAAAAKSDVKLSVDRSMFGLDENTKSLLGVSSDTVTLFDNGAAQEITKLIGLVSIPNEVRASGRAPPRSGRHGGLANPNREIVSFVRARVGGLEWP